MHDLRYGSGGSDDDGISELSSAMKIHMRRRKAPGTGVVMHRVAQMQLGKAEVEAYKWIDWLAIVQLCQKRERKMLHARLKGQVEAKVAKAAAERRRARVQRNHRPSSEQQRQRQEVEKRTALGASRAVEATGSSEAMPAAVRKRGGGSSTAAESDMIQKLRRRARELSAGGGGVAASTRGRGQRRY
jgi:hypothetical protein